MNDSNLSSPDAAEAAFYAAFERCDIKAMGAVWASVDVICIHPGSAALLGREAVMRSWTNILSNAEPPHVRIKVVRRAVSENLAVHVVEEHITSGYGDSVNASVVLATNVYRLEGNGWRLLEHHASMPGLPRAGAHAAPRNKPTLQ